MAVIVDSSPLIGLARIARLGLLRELYEQVLIPQTVYREVVVEGKRLRKPGAKEIEHAVKVGWIQVVALTKSQLENVEKYRINFEIGRGEAEAIVLARSRKLPLILDDKYARELATTIGIEFMGTGAVLLEAFLINMLSKKEFLESLRELGKVMWLSPDVIAQLLRLAEEE